MVKFSKFCSESFTALPIDVVVFKCRKKIIRREIGETVRYSHYKKKQKFGFLSNLRYCAYHVQSMPRASHQHLAHNIPNVTFGGL